MLTDDQSLVGAYGIRILMEPNLALKNIKLQYLEPAKVSAESGHQENPAQGSNSRLSYNVQPCASSIS